MADDLQGRVTAEAAPARRRRPPGWVYPALLVAAVLLCYGRILGHVFLLYDDPVNVAGNPLLISGRWQDLAEFWRARYFNFYAPSAYTLWFLLASLPGARLGPHGQQLAAWPFLAGNLALHLANTLLVFGLLRRLLRHDGAACCGALLFAVHPVQVECVAWISALKDLLAACFSLLALRAYVAYAGPETALELASRRRNYLLALAATLAALGSKPSAVTLPLLLLVVDRWLLGRSWRQAAAVLWWLLPAAAMVWVTRAGEAVDIRTVTEVWQRPLLAADALGVALSKLLFPLHLALDYSHTPHWVLAERHWLAYGLVAVVALSVWAVAARRRPVAVAAGLLYLCALLPTLGLIPGSFQQRSTAADRYQYLALLGPALLLAYLLARRPRWRPGWVLAALLLVALAGRSWVRVGDWRDEGALNRATLRVSPRSLGARENLAVWLARQGQREEARGLLHEVLRLDPDSPLSHQMLGELELAEGRPEAARPWLERAAQLEPNSATAELDLAGVALAQRRPDEAAQHYRRALQIDPRRWRAHLGLGDLLADQGRYADAVRQYVAGIELAPFDVTLHTNLTVALVNLRRPDLAVDEALRVVELAPGDPQAWQLLAGVRAANHQPAEARQAAQRALELQPDNAAARELLRRLGP